MPQMLIRVDDRDRVIGRATRRACHTRRGLRHRAFLVMLFNAEGELLLARRHRSKWLWPGWWDGTVAGHVLVGETYASAARRRVFEELGVRPRLRRGDKFADTARGQMRVTGAREKGRRERTLRGLRGACRRRETRSERNRRDQIHQEPEGST